MTDAEAAAFYAKPENQAPAPGAVGRRRTTPALTTHVPVRFPPETIERVRVLAEADGRTVSSWIRRAVDRALDAPSLSVGTGSSSHATWTEE